MEFEDLFKNFKTEGIEVILPSGKIQKLKITNKGLEKLRQLINVHGYEAFDEGLQGNCIDSILMFKI